MEFEFTGKIDSATFVDRDNTTIEILFKRDKDSDDLYVYNLPVDYAADDFKGFLEEWSLEKVEQETRITRRSADEAFDQMIQAQVAEALAKGQRLLDEQDKERRALSTRAYKMADEYKKALEDKVDKNEQERIAAWRLNNPTTSRAVAASDLLMYTDQFNDNKNFLFDLKLAIFEDPTITNIKDKDVKLQIRKAKSIYEAFELYCKLKKNYVQTVENVI
jgi:hypothetical protein